MNKKKPSKESIAQQALDSIRKPLPPVGYPFESIKDYRRRKKHSRKDEEDPYYASDDN